MDYGLSSQERRHYVRSQCCIDVLCAIPSDKNWLDVYTVRSKNICRKGLFLQTSDIVQPGRELYLQFSLIDFTSHFKIFTKVIWNRFDRSVEGMGVFFTEINETFESMIDHYALKHYNFKSASNF